MKTSHTQLCVPNFMAALVTVVRNWEKPKCPSPDEWTLQFSSVHAMEYYSAVKGME